MVDVLALAEDFPGWADHYRVPLFEWQREAFGQATRRDGGRFVHQLAGISVPRGNGKSYGAAAVGAWRLLMAPAPAPQVILSVALDYDGGRIVLDHGKSILQSHPELERSVEFRSDSIVVPSTGSRWLVRSREHTASRGLHPDLVVYDEIGWVRDDDLFASLLAAQAGVSDPLMLVASTVGRRQSGPLWRVKELAESEAPGVLWWYARENLSPRVSPDFLARQQRILLPTAFAREHENRWIEASDSYTTAAEVDDAMDGAWVESLAGDPAHEHVIAVDLGLVHDPSVVGVGHVETVEGAALVCIDRLVTFQGSREEPVQLEAVEAEVRDLATRFRTRTIIIETWQGAGLAQRLERAGYDVTLFAPTPRPLSEQWSALRQLLASRRLVLPVHPRLREELLGLSYDVGPTGVRVSDRGSVHQDHAVVVRLLAAALVREMAREPVRLW